MMMQLQSSLEQMPTSHPQVREGPWRSHFSHALVVRTSRLHRSSSVHERKCRAGLPQSGCNAVTHAVMSCRMAARPNQPDAVACPSSHHSCEEGHLPAGALLDNAKAHLALKTSLLFEKEMLIANIQKKATAAEKGGEGGSRLWSIFGRRSSSSGPQSDRPSTWREL